jgi:hypothetical protein
MKPNDKSTTPQQPTPGAKPSAQPRRAEPATENTTNLDGLYVHGMVASRTRQPFTAEDKPNRLLIVFTIQTKHGSYKIERWEDGLETPKDLPVSGDNVTIRVNMRAFVQNNHAEVRLTWAGTTREESF